MLYIYITIQLFEKKMPKWIKTITKPSSSNVGVNLNSKERHQF